MQYEEFIISTLIFRGLQFLQFNAHEIYENEQFNFLKNSQSIGIGLYLNSSKFNHQCYAATMR